MPDANGRLSFYERMTNAEFALREVLDAMDAVDAEAERAEANGGKGWSSAPVVRLLHAREKAHAVLTKETISDE